MMRAVGAIFLVTGLAGCGLMPKVSGILNAEPTPEGANTSVGSSDVRLGNGYRGADDPCRRAGSTSYTAPMLRSDADLVACPLDFNGRPAFQRTTGASEMGRTSDYVLYSVPLLGSTLSAPSPTPPAPEDGLLVPPPPA